MYNRDEIGKRIKSARQEKHLSQMQFAELINVSTPYLSDIENGKTNLSLDIFTRIVEVLQISADWLIMADIPQTMEYSSAEYSADYGIFLGRIKPPISRLFRKRIKSHLKNG